MRVPILALVFLLAPAFQATAQDAPLDVTVSFSVLGDMVRQIGGDRVRVEALVGPDGDAHVFQPSPSDARRLAASRVFVVNGLGLEGWLDRLTISAGFTGLTVTATDGVATLASGAGPDPHAWQDVGNAEIYARNIEAGLAAADPAHEATYREHLAQYGLELAELDQWVRQQIATVPPDKRKIITTHDAFGYFGRAYGVTLQAAVGMSEDSEPSAAAVAALIRQVRRDGTKALFVENMTDPRLIQELASEAGATVGGTLFADALSKPGGGGETYVAMIRHNVTLMVAAMGRN